MSDEASFTSEDAEAQRIQPLILELSAKISAACQGSEIAVCVSACITQLMNMGMLNPDAAAFVASNMSTAAELLPGLSAAKAQLAANDPTTQDAGAPEAPTLH
jgi:hypothetical protein